MWSIISIQADVLVLDFSKAFDKVSHTKLTQKLNFYCICGQTNGWIGFLRNRSQAVVVEGEKSDYVSVISGVPQGSVLGPSLFLSYINDISEGLNSTVRLFVDDTIAYLAIKSKRDTRLLQDDLNILADWETRWQMEFHQHQHQPQGNNHPVRLHPTWPHPQIRRRSQIPWSHHNEGSQMEHSHRKCQNKSKQSPGLPEKKPQNKLRRPQAQSLQDTIKTNGGIFGNHLGSLHQGQLETVQRRAARFICDEQMG